MLSFGRRAMVAAAGGASRYCWVHWSSVSTHSIPPTLLPSLPPPPTLPPCLLSLSFSLFFSSGLRLWYVRVTRPFSGDWGQYALQNLHQLRARCCCLHHALASTRAWCALGRRPAAVKQWSSTSRHLLWPHQACHLVWAHQVDKCRQHLLPIISVSHNHK